MKEHSNEDDTPDGYRRLYLYDEFDRFISAAYGLEVDEYIQLVDEQMSEKDAEAFIDFTLEERFEEGREILDRYLNKNDLE
jgi:hypothetical protein